MKIKKNKSKINKVCPLCRTHGLNFRLYDARNEAEELFLTVAACNTCKGLYIMEKEDDSS